jgi:hypothetical protein
MDGKREPAAYSGHGSEAVCPGPEVGERAEKLERMPFFLKGVFFLPQIPTLIQMLA